MLCVVVPFNNYWSRLPRLFETLPEREGLPLELGITASHTNTTIRYPATTMDIDKNRLEVGGKDLWLVEPHSRGGEDPLDPPDPAATVPAKNETFMQAAKSKALRPFVIISSSYLLFTITDGAIRMIVLLHAYNKAFSALQVAIMFTLYELAGVFTNLVRAIPCRDCPYPPKGGY